MNPLSKQLSPRQCAVYQTGLQAMGHYHGAIDGQWGGETDAAEQRSALDAAVIGQRPPVVAVDDSDVETGRSGDSESWWTGPGKYARRTGVRHKNPLNLKGSGWKGQVAKDERGHAIFEDAAFGIRAALVNLQTYWTKHGLRDLLGICTRWAPPSDTIGSRKGAAPNAPAEYAAFLSRKMGGVGVRSRLALFRDRDACVDDVLQLENLITAMAEYEVGAGFRLDPDTVRRAIVLL